MWDRIDNCKLSVQDQKQHLICANVLACNTHKFLAPPGPRMIPLIIFPENHNNARCGKKSRVVTYRQKSKNYLRFLVGVKNPR